MLDAAPALISRTAARSTVSVFRPEEVELHQPGLLDIFHVELGDRHVRARIAVHRHQLATAAGRRSPRRRHGSRRGGRGLRASAPCRAGVSTCSAPSRRLGEARLALDRLGQRDRVGRVVRHHLARAGRPGRRASASTRPTSRSTARACSVAEGDDLRRRWSRPYFSWT